MSPADRCLPFALAGGSVLGRHHHHLGMNNQDAWGWVHQPWGTIAVVCDGCGSTPHSEVGSQLGVRWVLQELTEALQRGDNPEEFSFWEMLQQALQHQIRRCAESLGSDLTLIVRDYFLFTIVGVVLTPELTTIFGAGDGIYILNGEVYPLEATPENAPGYLAYGLLNPAQLRPSNTDRLYDISVYHQCATATVNSLLLGTDGVLDLQNLADTNLPGKSEPVGSLAQFWTDDRYFKNPNTLRRRLALINREVIQPDWSSQQLHKSSGLLSDDTTLICLRRMD